MTTNQDIPFFPFVPILPNLYHGLYQLFWGGRKNVGRIRTERGVHTGPDARKPPGCVKNHPRTRSAVGFRPFIGCKRICQVEGLYTHTGKHDAGQGVTAAVGQDRTAPDSVAAPLFLLFPLSPFLNFIYKRLSILYSFVYSFYFGFLYIIFPVCIK